MDSPDTSLYKPVSLSDTLTQNSKRAYRSSGATLTSSTSTHRLAGPRPSIAQTPSWHSRDRSDAAKREAAAMCEVLGIPGSSGDSAVDATPRPSSGRSLNSAATARTGTIREESPVEVISLKATLGDKDHEIAALRRELAVALRDKKDLAAQVARCERDHRDSATASGSGLDIRQMEDLERAFADQEKLLAGYQKELEKQAEELDRTRTRSRRMAEYLEKAYGPAFEEDLGLSERSKGGATSPAVRHKLAARASIAGGPPTGFAGGGLSRATTVPTSLTAHAIPETNESADLAADSTLDLSASSAARQRSESPHSRQQQLVWPSTGSTLTASAAAAAEVPTAALAQHLDSVHSLLRSMEARLISRDVELAEIERRARQDTLAAQKKQQELEALVAQSRDSTVAAV